MDEINIVQPRCASEGNSQRPVQKIKIASQWLTLSLQLHIFLQIAKEEPKRFPL